jgi:hypothetical protein
MRGVNRPTRSRMLLAATAAVAAMVVLALAAGYVAARRVQVPASSSSSRVPPFPSASAAPSAPSSAPRVTRTMDTPGFWGLVSDTRRAAAGDTGRQSSLLEARLRELPPRAIVAYQRIRHRLDRRAYTWDIWGAASVIEDGCSDDCFRDFRAYLISLGRDTFERALRDPDSLAPVVQDAEQGDWENADSVAGDAYENATGEDLPVDDSDLDGTPRGRPWDDDAEGSLIRRYPRLAARFR